MTTEEKAALIYRCRDAVGHLKQMVEVGIRGGRYSVTEYRYQLMINEIALAAMTAEPVGRFIQWDSGDEETGPEIEWVEANTKEAIPLYKCAPVAAPEGWRLVPVEPTVEMLHASYRESAVYSPSAYRAMIAAAPAP